MNWLRAISLIVSMSKLIVFSLVLILCLQTIAEVESGDSAAAASNGELKIKSVKLTLSVFSVATLDLGGELDFECEN